MTNYSSTLSLAFCITRRLCRGWNRCKWRHLELLLVASALRLTRSFTRLQLISQRSSWLLDSLGWITALSCSYSNTTYCIFCLLLGLCISSFLIVTLLYTFALHVCVLLLSQLLRGLVHIYSCTSSTNK